MTGKRIHALTHTRSGALGEVRVAAELLRCGLRVAQPYWNDDESDLLVMIPFQTIPFPLVSLSIQVKTVQPLQLGHGTVPLQGIRRRYLDSNPTLTLAIYRPDTDQIWLIPGPQNIRKEYDRQAHKSRTSKRRGWDEIPPESEVNLSAPFDDPEFNTQWRVPRDDAQWLSQKINELAQDVANLSCHAILTQAFADDDPT